MTTKCNECGKDFDMHPEDIKTLFYEEELEVKYFICPHCGSSYVFFASDEKMRKLVAQRKGVEQQILAARALHFKSKVIRGYIRNLEKIKAEQKLMLPKLLKRGEEVLAELEK